jgi:hypothetical protein
VPLEPKLQDVLRDAFDALQNEVHTCLPGRVKSYDSATQTAEVIPVVKQSLPNEDGSRELVELPVLPNVPVAWPRAGGCYLHFPMAAGDHVLLVFSEAAFALWRETGQISEPGDLSRHSLSYAHAIPGIAPDANAFPDAPGSEAVLVVGSGVLRVSAASGSAQFVALANLVSARLDAIQAAFDAHTHPYVDTPIGAAVTSVPAAPIGPLAPVAATKLKAQ